MKIFSYKPRRIVAATLVLLLLFLLRPGASRLKSRIISSISTGVGRPVDIGSVHIRLLPRPGFELENLVVYDDPLFGAEPMLRANEVTADLRLASLVRGRLEIARLDLTEPSLNLVHREGARWNVEALLERATRASLVATANGKSEAGPHFPYIAGSSGRINFKNGAEKKPYALINADFSFWHSEGSWGGRLKAQPFRSDLNLNDVGQLQIEATWQPAESLGDTPLHVNAEWAHAQVGQVTKFITGNDKGWRGEIQLDAVLSGNPTKLSIISTASIDDFRRYDITTGKALRLAGRCDAEYSASTHEFGKILCSSPVGEGFLKLTGNVGLPSSGRYAISINADSVPATAALIFTERLKRNLPDDLKADGTLQGTISLHRDGVGTIPRYDGQGQVAGFHLSSETTKAELGPTTVPFLLLDDSVQGGRRMNALSKLRAATAFPKGAHVELGPVALNSGRNTGATARGWFSRTGYNLGVAGESDVARILRIARMTGIPALAASAEGLAQVNFQISGAWIAPEGNAGVGFPAPQITGTAKLKNVLVTASGPSEPVQINSAEMQFAPDGVHVRKLNAKAAGSIWTGSVDLPRDCRSPDVCPVRFTLTVDGLSTSGISEWVNGGSKSRPWYRVLQSSSNRSQSIFARMRASGHLNANRFVIHGVSATGLSANVSIADGKLQLSGLEGNVLGAQHRGKWVVDFSIKPAVCSGIGTLAALSLSPIGASMEDDWISGTASANYQLEGPCTSEFWRAADGTVQVEMKNGALPHVLLGDNAEPLKIVSLTGEAQLHSGTIEVRSATLDSPAGAYQISGTVSLNRELDIKLARMPADTAHAGYEITGTLAEPRVSPFTSNEQARLKPLPAKQ